MKRKRLMVLITTMAVASLCSCGKEKFSVNVSEIDIELGEELSTDISEYVSTDGASVSNAEVDFSAVDTTKVGTYSGYIKNGDETFEIKVNVEDTTAPVAEIDTTVSIKYGETLSIDDIVYDVTEASGKVTASFGEITVVESVEQEESTTESTESTEEIEDEDDVADNELPSTFKVSGVEVTNGSITFDSMGEYSVGVTVADESGNESVEEIQVIVGNAPVMTGLKDVEIEVGQVEFDFTSYVEAKDFKGNDITSRIVCNPSTVNIDEEGEYEVVYTVADEYGFTATESVVVTVVGKSNTTSTSASTVSSQSSSTTSSNTSTQSVTNTQDVTSTQDVSSSTAEQSSQQASNTDTSSSEGSQQEVSSTSVSENTVSESTSSTVSDSTSAGSEAPVTSVDASGWTLDELNAATGSTATHDAEAAREASSQAGVGGSWVTMGP